MAGKLTVSKKIILGFGCVLVLTLIVGGIGYNELRNATNGFTAYREMARDANLAGQVQASMLMARIGAKDFINTGNEGSRTKFFDTFGQMAAFLSTAKNEIRKPERADRIKSIDMEQKKYAEAFSRVVDHMNARDQAVHQLSRVLGPRIEKNLTEIMHSAHRDNDAAAAYRGGLVLRNLLLARVYATVFLDTNSREDAERVHREFSEMQTMLKDLDRELQDADRRRQLLDVTGDMQLYEKGFDDLVRIISERNELISATLDRIGPEIARFIDEVKLDIKSEQDRIGPRLVESNKKAIFLMGLAAALALLVGGFLAAVITRSITGPLHRVIEGLDTGAQEVASASGQVASSSQSLAEGASEQAASIEETSSSLEEMAAMTRQNADNTAKAETLMQEAGQVVSNVDQLLTQLAASMDDISTVSEETGNIIKTIDEIAFQTNLLALNAAVEAARAGAAGAGFAVVADEVRNLAIRSSKAAKDTARLIENTLQSVHTGQENTRETVTAFQKNREIAEKIGVLIAEISAASAEQSQGIEQVNTAASEMDRVTQQNAANAEESASAAEELSAQAEHMKGFVEELIGLVEGNRDRRYRKPAPAKNGKRAHPSRRGAAALSGKRRPDLAGRDTKAPPHKMIPLDADDFEDF